MIFFKKTWNTKDTCFDLHGVPVWYKELTEKKKRENFTLFTSEVPSTTTMIRGGGDDGVTEIKQKMAQIQMDMQRIMGKSGQTDHITLL